MLPGKGLGISSAGGDPVGVADQFGIVLQKEFLVFDLPENDVAT